MISAKHYKEKIIQDPSSKALPYIYKKLSGIVLIHHEICLNSFHPPSQQAIAKRVQLDCIKVVPSIDHVLLEWCSPNVMETTQQLKIIGQPETPKNPSYIS